MAMHTAIDLVPREAWRQPTGIVRGDLLHIIEAETIEAVRCLNRVEGNDYFRDQALAHIAEGNPQQALYSTGTLATTLKQPIGSDDHNAAAVGAIMALEALVKVTTAQRLLER